MVLPERQVEDANASVRPAARMAKVRWCIGMSILKIRASSYKRLAVTPSGVAARTMTFLVILKSGRASGEVRKLIGKSGGSPAKRGESTAKC
jgi:hypothetical protein